MIGDEINAPKLKSYVQIMCNNILVKYYDPKHLDLVTLQLRL
jgi:hypothetical protein